MKMKPMGTKQNRNPHFGARFDFQISSLAREEIYLLSTEQSPAIAN